MKRCGVLLLTTIALLLVAGIAGVLAYYTDSEQQNNRFQTATNKVEITEEFPPGDKTPGEPFTKKVAVKNDGSEAYVRVKVRFSDGDMEKYCTVDYNTTDWKYADGYYYYTKVLPESSTTPNLFTQVTIAKDIPDDVLKDFNIYVEAESIQVGYFQDYTEAWTAFDKNR